jgi:hypothetical protein
MGERDTFLLFVRPLNVAGFRYAVTGSIAAILYGEPRLTYDVDFVVFLNEQNIRQLNHLFPESEFYVPPPETIHAEVARERSGHFNIIHIETGFKADFYPTGRDELNAWAFRNKRQVQFQEETVIVAPPEYVIVRKLEYYREGGSDKHVRDIRSMLAVSGDEIDRSELNDWIQRRGLQEVWSKAQHKFE